MSNRINFASKISTKIAALAVLLVISAAFITDWMYFTHVSEVMPLEDARVLRLQNVILAFGLVAVAAIVVIIFGRIISRPLSRMATLAETFPEDTDISDLPVHNKDEIGTLARSLSRLVTEVSEQEWLRTGQLKIAESARGDLKTEDTAYNILKAICTYLDAPLGAFYKKTDDDKLSLIAGYAIKRQPKAVQEIEEGNSVLSIALEDGLIKIDNDLPDDYFRIHSGLGEIKPKHRMITPLFIESKPIGVIEIAGLKPFTEQHKFLLKRVREAVGLVVIAAQARENVERMLFDEKVQHEELRISSEQLEKQAAEMERQQDELQQQATEMEAQNRQLEEQKSQIENQARDIEHKLSEIERASKYKSEFLANMSHELRTPLNSLLILAKAFQTNEEGNLTEEQVDEAAMIYNGGVELLSLINDVLDFSKIEAGHLKITRDHIPITTLAQKLIKQFTPLAKERSITLDANVTENVPETLYTDSQRLEQILKNLLSNAIKFTDSGGVSLNISSDNTHIVFTVRDTGIGISQDKQQEIFEAFKQADGSIDRKYGGTGLGLSISRQLTDLLGGHISVESEEAKGSTFTLTLPLSAAEDDIADAEQISSDAMVTLQSQSVRKIEHGDNISTQKTLLIVEDDNKFASTIKKLAAKEGYIPLIAHLGKDALMMVHAHMPVAVILDLALPDMNGLRVLEHLKSDLKTRHIPVHVISAIDEQSKEIMQRGAVGYLTKPVTVEQMDAMFANVANIIQKTVKNVLVIEDDKKTQIAIEKLLNNKQLDITSVSEGKIALDKTAKQKFDCIILDLQLPDMSGFDWLKHAQEKQGQNIPPVIVYTARKLTKQETQTLEEYTGSIIIKGAHAPDRLVDEVMLFLHSVEASLNEDQRRVINMKHNPNEVLNGRKVLLVDDDMRNVFAISKMLKKQGIEVVVADNGQMALEQLDKESGIELIVMDIMMPVMDGYEATKVIRTDPVYKDIPVIALTARTAADEREKCLQACATDYLAKPVDIDVLLALLRILMFEQKNR